MDKKQTYSLLLTINDHKSRPMATLRIADSLSPKTANERCLKLQAISDAAGWDYALDTVKTLRHLVVRMRLIAPAALRAKFSVIPD